MDTNRTSRTAPTTTVGWDGSAPSRTALLWAIERERSGPASRWGGLLLVAVIDDAFRSLGEAALEQLALAARHALDAELAWIAVNAAEISVDATVVVGDPVAALPARCPPDALLVVGHRSRTTKTGRALAARLAATATQPVVVVPDGLGAVKAQVVVGVDGTPAAVRASVAAAKEAERRDAPLHVVHTWNGGGSMPLADYADIESQRRDHERILAAAVDAIRSDHPALVVQGHLEIGSPEHVLGRWATDAALLVVGSRGRGPVRRLLLGSVSTKLLESRACPVMIVTAPHTPARN
jgi:nucleotide-binding universal stress UspA family protein